MCAHPENQLGVIEGGTAAVCGVEHCKVGLVLAFQRDDVEEERAAVIYYSSCDRF